LWLFYDTHRALVLIFFFLISKLSNPVLELVILDVEWSSFSRAQAWTRLNRELYNMEMFFLKTKKKILMFFLNVLCDKSLYCWNSLIMLSATLVSDFASLASFLMAQWADPGITNKRCLFPLEACWSFQVYEEPFTSKSGHFAFRTCRLVIWSVLYFAWSKKHAHIPTLTYGITFQLQILFFNSWRALSTNACQGFGTLLWSQIAAIRCDRLFS